MNISIIGCGTMGLGIVQLASSMNNKVVAFEKTQDVLVKSKHKFLNTIEVLVSKSKLSIEDSKKIIENIHFTNNLHAIRDSELVIEAIIEDFEAKKNLFIDIESIVSDNCIIASNTSSLSISKLSSLFNNKTRFLGIHFFNPVPIMKLVEIIPSLFTKKEVIDEVEKLLTHWNKEIAIAKDTPGFIVNKVARPFYGEALRIYDEGIASFDDIDFAMKNIGGFRMGPFELMDFIGNDVNYTITKSIFESFYYDPRYKPSLTQKSYFESGLLGRKTNQGFYKYPNDNNYQSTLDSLQQKDIFNRIIVMLINEAADTVYQNIASVKDVDKAMKYGTNYPKGLFEWCDELGIDFVIDKLHYLSDKYMEDRYRISPLLKQLKFDNKKFYQ